MLSKGKNEKFTINIKPKKGGIIYWTKPSIVSVLFSILAVISILIILAMVVVPAFPEVLYRVIPGMSKSLSQILLKTPVSFGDLLRHSGEEEAEIYQPPIDKTLPVENQIIIDKIGIKTEIIEESHDNYENALRKGIWRVPDFGTPFNRQYPTILVAHRFGYLEWSSQYRRENSFYNLPKLDVGDRISIIWNQRKYIYEITGLEESEQITDYSADLILYTCKYLKSTERIFRYAKLVRK